MVRMQIIIVIVVISRLIVILCYDVLKTFLFGSGATPCSVNCFNCATTTTGWPQTWKPWNTRDFSEHGKLREFCATSGKNCNKQSIFSLSFKYLGKAAVDCCPGPHWGSLRYSPRLPSQLVRGNLPIAFPSTVLVSRFSVVNLWSP